MLNHFRSTLQPFIDLMDYKKSKLSEEGWLRFVESIKESIIRNPEQFLGKELPRKEVIKDLVQEIFDEYLLEREALV